MDRIRGRRRWQMLGRLSRVQHPTHLGGLGILDLRLLGIALRVRWPWLQRVELDRLWSSLAMTTDPRTQAFFSASTRFVLGDGNAFKFWNDPWIRGACIRDLAPDLLAAVSSSSERRRTVAQGIMNNAWIGNITGVLMVPVLIQYLELHQRLQHIELDGQLPDKVEWRWTASGQYSSTSAYAALQFRQAEVAGARQLWKVRAPNSYRFFMWLAHLDRCWTAERHRRYGLQDSSTCPVCMQAEESIHHLLLQCPFVREIWFKIFRRCGWQQHTPTREDMLAPWWLTARKSVAKPRQQAFDSLVLLTAWSIWNHRNGKVFRNVLMQPQCLVNDVWESVALWSWARHLDRPRLFGE
jgi:hypothetical protein